MTLTHTNTQGVSGPCEAKLGRCPFGPQFTSMEEARQYNDLKRRGLRTDLTQTIDHTPTTGGISGAGRFVDVPTSLWGTMRMRDGDLNDPRNRYALANGLCGDLAAAIIRKDPTRRPVFVTHTWRPTLVTPARSRTSWSPPASRASTWMHTGCTRPMRSRTSTATTQTSWTLEATWTSCARYQMTMNP